MDAIRGTKICRIYLSLGRSVKRKERGSDFTLIRDCADWDEEFGCGLVKGGVGCSHQRPEASILGKTFRGAGNRYGTGDGYTATPGTKKGGSQ
jgi:hypothetical protein